MCPVIARTGATLRPTRQRRGRRRRPADSPPVRVHRWIRWPRRLPSALGFEENLSTSPGTDDVTGLDFRAETPYDWHSPIESANNSSPNFESSSGLAGVRCIATNQLLDF